MSVPDDGAFGVSGGDGGNDAVGVFLKKVGVGVSGLWEEALVIRVVVGWRSALTFKYIYGIQDL